MIKGIKNEIRYIMRDWYRYMDTTTPRGANYKKYTQAKYSNKAKLKEFTEQHREVELSLMYTIAMHEYLQKSDEEILESLQEYMDEVIL